MNEIENTHKLDNLINVNNKRNVLTKVCLLYCKQLATTMSMVKLGWTLYMYMFNKLNFNIILFFINDFQFLNKTYF